MTKTLHNKCFNTRINIEGKAYRVFSVIFKHPSETDENDWTLLKGTTSGKPIIVDKTTMSILANHEINRLTREESMVSFEPTIIGAEITPCVDEKESTLQIKELSGDDETKN